MIITPPKELLPPVTVTNIALSQQYAFVEDNIVMAIKVKGYSSISISRENGIDDYSGKTVPYINIY